MGPKSMLFVLIIGVFLASECQGHLKLKLLKAKLIAAKVPHIAAKVAVAKEIKAKTAIAVAKKIGALKASKAALFSIVTAPFRVAKKAVAIKIGAIKAAKLLKLAKVAHAVKKLKVLKKHPIIVPIPVPYKVPVPFPLIGKSKGGLEAGLIGGALGSALGGGALGSALGAGALGSALGAGGLGGLLSGGPVQGLISGAQNIIKTAGNAFPLLSTFNNGNSNVNSAPYAPAVVQQPEPVYRFVPSVQYTPTINVDVPVRAPHNVYGLP